MKYKAVIFDLDGTLMDTLRDLTDAMNTSLRQLGQKELTQGQCRQLVGKGLAAFAAEALPADNLHLAEELCRLMVETYRQNLIHFTKPYEGIPELVSGLKKAKVPLAVITNKRHDISVKIVEYFFGNDTFGTIVGLKDGINPKPNPSTTLDFLRQNGVLPNEAIFVGDSEVDVETARNAGTDIAAVSWGFRDPQQLLGAGAVRLYDNPMQLWDLLT